MDYCVLSNEVTVFQTARNGQRQWMSLMEIADCFIFTFTLFYLLRKFLTLGCVVSHSKERLYVTIKKKSGGKSN